MKKTLQDQYLLIKEGKGHKDVFMKEAKHKFPNLIRNAATFNEVVATLKDKSLISENIVGLEAINSFQDSSKQSFEVAFSNFLKESQEEEEKAELKKPSKQVDDNLYHGFNTSDKSNPDNLIFDQIMKGYYTEMKDPKNEGKTMGELKSIVFKNLEKNPIYYTEDGQFGVKGLGYQTEAPGLGTPKEAKGKYKASGYGDLKEGIKRNYPNFIDSEYQGEEERLEGDELYTYLVDTMAISRGEDDFIQKIEYGLTDETSSLSPEDRQKLRTWYQENSGEKIKFDLGRGFVKESLEESKLRKVIREIVDTEMSEMRGGGNYGILSINTSGKGGGGKRFIPTVINMPLSLRKKFGDHMVYNPASETFYISQILYNNLIKGYAEQPDIKRLIMDIPPMLKQLLNKTPNYGRPTELPKQFKIYLPFITPVEKAKEDKFNKAGTKQYWAAGDFLFPNLNKGKYSSDSLDENSNSTDHYISVIASNQMSKDDAYDYLEDQGVNQNMIDSIIVSAFPMDMNESKLRKVIRESIEKELATINQEAEMEILDSKLEKIQSAIEKRQSQLTKLDEDEDMKALTDKTKVKQIQKDIKALEKAKSKIEKQLSKKDKPAKSEIIDEDETIDEAIDDKKLDDTTKSLDDIDKKVEDISKKTTEMFENENNLPQDILNQVVEKFADMGGDRDSIPTIAASFPNYEEEIIEFLDGYDLGLDYDI